MCAYSFIGASLGAILIYLYLSVSCSTEALDYGIIDEGAFLVLVYARTFYFFFCFL